jgi:hypothetical protein
MNNYISFLVCAVIFALCGAMQPIIAQNSLEIPTKPRVSLRVVNERDALPWLEAPPKYRSMLTVDETGATISMHERQIGIFRRDTAFQTGSIGIDRSGFSLDQLLVVAYSLEYLDSAQNPLPNIGSPVLYLPVELPVGAIVTPPLPPALPVAINGLQGDLSPTIADANGVLVPIALASRQIPNTANILPGQTRVLLNFTSRWSDHSFSPRSPGLQGQRKVRIILLSVNEQNYTTGVTLATVFLTDPQRVTPVLVNAIQNKLLLRGSGDLIELETPGFRSDGMPNAVFYDENYNVLTYTAVSSDSSIISSKAFQSDPRVNGRPSLFYTVLPNAPIGSIVAITIIADDGTGFLASNIFTVQVVGTISSVQKAPIMPFLISPNPTSDLVTIESLGKQNGYIRVRLLTTLGIEVYTGVYLVGKGESYRYSFNMALLPAGMYMVEVQDGASRSVRKIMKN